MTAAAGARRLSSGYLIADNVVLTVAHSVRHAGTAADVYVRFNAGAPNERAVPAVRTVVDVDGDLALVLLETTPVAVTGPVRFGALPRRGASLAFTAVGHPAWKLRRVAPADATVRLTHQAEGRIAPMSNAATGTLELTLAGPPPEPDRPGVNPWEGFSGSALWVEGHLVGLAAVQHAAESYGRLGGIRIETVYNITDPALRQEFVGALRLPDRRDLPLVDAAGTPPSHLLSGLRFYAREIGPDLLRDRDDELDAFVRFCRSADPYSWWVGTPWAGKTALAAWFASRPPPNLVVVAFFVTARIRGQSTSPDFLNAVVPQLAAIAGEPPPALTDHMSGVGTFQRLVHAAADELARREATLVLLVDGLDEDLGAHVASGMHSIATLLPRDPPPNVKVLVTSRTDPGLPGDVVDEHPLRRVEPRRLRPSPHARNQRVAAERELQIQLGGDALHRRILGLLVAAGGGLTVADLAVLLERHRVETDPTAKPVGRLELDALLQSAFARSLEARPEPSAPTERIYLFAHDTLRETAETELRAAAGDFLAVIHRWAEDYEQRQWPTATPRYLLRPYGDLLNQRQEVHRLCRLALDVHRHERLWQTSHSDIDAINELADARSLVAAQGEHADLATLAELAVWADRLTRRNGNVPVELPEVWISLGEPDVAVTLARGLADPVARCSALAGAASVAVDGLPVHLMDEALAALNTMDESAHRLDIAVRIAANLASAGSVGAAVRLVESLEHPIARSVALLDVVRAVRDAGRHEQAEALAARVEDAHVRELAAGPTAEEPPRPPVDALEVGRDTVTPAAVAGVAAELHRLDAAAARALLDRAVARARAQRVESSRALGLAAIAQRWRAVDTETAAALLTDALRLARSVGPALERYTTVRSIRTILSESQRTAIDEELAELAKTVDEALLPTGPPPAGPEPDLVARATDEHVAYARTLVDVMLDGRLDDETHTQLAVELRHFADPDAQGPLRPAALIQVAAELAHRNRTLADDLADHIVPAQWRAEVRSATARPPRGRRDEMPYLRRQACAGALPDRGAALAPVTHAELIRLAALSGQADLALLHAHARHIVARLPASSDEAGLVAALLAGARLGPVAADLLDGRPVRQRAVAAAAGDADELIWARDLLLRATPTDERDWALVELGTALAQAGHAAAVADIATAFHGAHAAIGIDILAAQRAPEDLERHAGNVPEPMRSWLTGQVARQLATTQPRRAIAIAREVHDPATRVDALNALAGRLASHDAAQARRLLGEARETWRHMPSTGQRTRLGAAIAIRYARVDAADAALTLALDLEPGVESPRALAAIACVLVARDAENARARLLANATEHLGHLPDAERAIAQAGLAAALAPWARQRSIWHAAEAEAGIRAGRDSIQRAHGLAVLADTLRRLDPARSCAVALESLEAGARPQIARSNAEAHARAAVALHPAEPGLAALALERALDTAAAIDNATERCQLQLTLSARIRPARPLRALALQRRAESALVEAAGRAERATVLARVARDVVEVDRDRARQLAIEVETLCRTTEADPRVSLTAELASGFANAGDLDTAVALAVRIPAPQHRANLFAALAIAAARIGDLARSCGLARDCTTRRQRQMVQETLVFALARRGAVTEAKALAGTLHATTGWQAVVEALPSLAPAAEQAVVAAAQADLRRSRSLPAAEAFAATCIALAEAGSADAAAQLYRTIAPGPDRNAPLPRLAYALARTGRSDLAAAVIAETTTDAALVAEATAAIAVGAGHRVRADAGDGVDPVPLTAIKRQLVHVLGGRHWTKALDAVGLVQPDALRSVADAIGVRPREFVDLVGDGSRVGLA
jgi:hypothetical protein